MKHYDQVINATPHPLDVYDDSGTEIVLVLPRNDADPIARAGERIKRLDNAVVAGVEVPMHGTAYGEISGLPEQQDGVFYFVALPPALAAGTTRTDLMVCGPAVRDGQGRMIGCKGFSLPHHPAVDSDC